MEKLIDQIHEARAAIEGVLSKNLLVHDKDGRAYYMLHVLRVFEVEFLVHLKEWDRVSTTVKVNSFRFKGESGRRRTQTDIPLQAVIKSGRMALGTTEAIADLLVRQPASCLLSLSARLSSLRSLLRWFHTVSGSPRIVLFKVTSTLRL